MAELEVHAHAEGGDPTGKKIGVLAAILAVLLGIVTIISHRSHTAAVLYKAEANDQWSYYQSKRIKFHSIELGEDLVHAQGLKTPEAASMLEHYAAEKKRYTKEYQEAQAEAEKTDKKAEHTEDQALRFDFSEGLIEIGMVLTSLYFISRSKLFPAVGVVSAALGVAAAVWGFLI
jgi:hypothetical protein